MLASTLHLIPSGLTASSDQELSDLNGFSLGTGSQFREHPMVATEPRSHQKQSPGENGEYKQKAMPCGIQRRRCSIYYKGCRRVTHRPRATESMWQGALPGWLSVLSHHSCLKWLLDKWKGQELGPLFSLSGKKHRALPFLTARAPSEPVWSEGAAAPPKAYLSLRK